MKDVFPEVLQVKARPLHVDKGSIIVFAFVASGGDIRVDFWQLNFWHVRIVIFEHVFEPSDVFPVPVLKSWVMSKWDEKIVGSNRTQEREVSAAKDFLNGACLNFQVFKNLVSFVAL